MQPSSLRSSYRLAVASLFTLWALLCTAELFGWWQWGHMGFNGASFAQAARNTFRYGMLGPFLWHTELAPPDPLGAYAHHPLLVHLHALLARALSGSDAPWVYRLTPALYSFGTLVVLWDLARRTGGRAFALTTALLYASFPGMAIFANVVIHEQGTLFWLVAAVWAELRYVATRRTRFRALALIAFFLALNFGWAAYFAAFFVFLHSLYRAFKHRHHARPRNRALGLAAGLIGVVFVSSGLFLAWAAWAKGGLAELVQTFTWRAGGRTVIDPWALAARPFAQLYGWVPAVLYALFLPTLALRRVRRRPEAMVALLFVATQLVHTTLFSQAASIHAYWEYYAAPGLALGAALGLQQLWLVPQRLLARNGRLLGGALLATGVLALVVIQLPFTVRQRRYGLETAGLSGWSRDYQEELRWLAEVGRLYPHGSAHFTFVQTLEDRPEVRHTLDGPIHFVRTATAPKTRQGVPNLLLADLTAVSNPAVRNRLARRAARAGFTWDERFVVIDPSLEPSGPPRHFRSIRSSPGPLHRWFVHHDAPVLRWSGTSGAAPDGDQATEAP